MAAILPCMKCGSAIPSCEIDRDLRLAHCSRCDHVMPLKGFAFEAPEPRLLLEANPVVWGVSVSENAGELTIRRRWFALKELFDLFVALFLGALFVVFIVHGSSGVCAITRSRVELEMILLPIFVFAGWFGFSYASVAGIVNTTTVTVARGRLSIEHSPLPWPGNREIYAGSLSQLHCMRHGTTWSVEATTHDQARFRLLSGLDSLALARFYEKKIESFLGIKNRFVPGEAAPGRA